MVVVPASQMDGAMSNIAKSAHMHSLAVRDASFVIIRVRALAPIARAERKNTAIGKALLMGGIAGGA